MKPSYFPPPLKPPYASPKPCHILRSSRYRRFPSTKPSCLPLLHETRRAHAAIQFPDSDTLDTLPSKINCLLPLTNRRVLLRNSRIILRLDDASRALAASFPPTKATRSHCNLLRLTRYQLTIPFNQPQFPSPIHPSPLRFVIAIPSYHLALRRLISLSCPPRRPDGSQRNHVA